jgi:AsmA protein
MGKTVKVVLVALGVIVVLFGAIIGYVVATFDPNQYKQYAVDAVRESTHRTLKLEGDIRLSVFPNLAMSVSRASLSEPNVDKTFLEAEIVRVSIRLLPLLSKRVEIVRVELKGVVAHVVRTKEGKLNFEDIIGAGANKPAEQGESPKPTDKGAPAKPSEPKPAAPGIEIVGLVLDDASIDYFDEAAGKRYALSKVRLETGRIADGVPGKIQLAFGVKADQPAVEFNVTAKTGFLFEAGKQHVRLDDLDLAIKGSGPGVTGLDAVAKGDIEVSAATSDILVSKLNLAASGKQPDGDFNLRLDVPKLALTGEKMSGEKISIHAVLRDAKQKIDAQLKIPGIEGSRQSFTVGPLEATVNVEGGGRTFKAMLASTITGNAVAKQVELSQITVTVNVGDPSLPKSPIEAKIEGSARLDLAKEEGAVQFVTKLDESRIEGKASITRFSQPAYTFDCSIDQLDADRYMPKPGAKKAEGTGPTAKPASESVAQSAEKPMDLSGPKGATANGTIRIDRLKVANLSSSQVRADIKLGNGRLDVNPLAANLYEGSLSGAFSAQWESVPVFRLKQQLSQVNLGALLKDAANSDKLEGKGTLSVDVTTQGTTTAALKKGLNGNAGLTVLDGSIKGIDLAGTIRDAKAKLRELRGKKTQGENKSEKTSFTEMKATFTIKNGVAHNSDLSMKSPLLRVAGEGDIDIGNDRLDYLVRPTLVGTTKGQGGREASDLAGVTVPVRITGPLKEPQYTIDFSALAEEFGKGLLDSAKEGLKGESGGRKKVQDRFKGLLGR